MKSQRGGPPALARPSLRSIRGAGGPPPRRGPAPDGSGAAARGAYRRGADRAGDREDQPGGASVVRIAGLRVRRRVRLPQPASALSPSSFFSSFSAPPFFFRN